MEHSKEIKLRVQNVSKGFRDEKGNFTKVIDNISFDVYDGEFLVLLGPGKCGKSVLLNMIAGLLLPDEGTITLDGEKVVGADPRMGMVFQKTGLMPWLNVMKNVTFGPDRKRIPRQESRKKAQHFIDLVGLTGFEKSYPYQLSGGMKQRVGIARAYTNDVEILIMDEPFGQLDAQTRYDMQKQIAKIIQTEKRTSIFVTNNIEEAIKLADRILLLDKCPAKVKACYDIDFEGERDEISPEFLRIREKISENMTFSL